MPQYLDRECRCPPDPYARFDSVISHELSIPLNAHRIVNDSEFCTMIQKDAFHKNTMTVPRCKRHAHDLFGRANPRLPTHDRQAPGSKRQIKLRRNQSLRHKRAGHDT